MYIPDSLAPSSSHVLVVVPGFEKIIFISKETNDVKGNNTVFNILHSTVTSS